MFAHPKLSAQAALDSLIEGHMRHYRTGAKELRPMLIVYHDRSPNEIIAVPMGDSDQKDTLALWIKAILKDSPDAYMIALITEAWMLKIDKDKMPRKMPVPSKSDQRIEVVMTLIQRRDGDNIDDMREIVRDWKTGRVVALKPDTTNQGNMMSGRFSNLFS